MSKVTPRKPIGRRPSSEGRRTFWMLVGAASLLCALGLAHTWTRIAYYDRKRLVGEAQEENKALMNLRQSEKVEITSLEATGRVDRIAQERFGMMRPSPDTIVVIEGHKGAASLDAPAGPGSIAAIER